MTSAAAGAGGVAPDWVDLATAAGLTAGVAARVLGELGTPWVAAAGRAAGLEDAPPRELGCPELDPELGWWGLRWALGRALGWALGWALGRAPAVDDAAGAPEGV